GLRLAGLTARDPAAVAFTPDSFVQVSSAGERIEVSFRLALTAFDPTRWQALMGEQPAPFHFLTLALPSATVWHQRGWLNATPNADPFPLLQDVHVGQPEISCPWNRNWSYLCPLGGHPIPVIGLWDPAARRYLAYDFQASRAGSQSERYLATAYCWQQGQEQSFIALCLPYGGRRFTELRYPEPGATAEATFELVIDELGSIPTSAFSGGCLSGRPALCRQFRP
ncbi:MAG: hypothetical protein HUU35_20035, partial [Armatimonadetes bacterium]|nr:hypothetical protein [Armatimonadota bacterium]